MSTRRGMRSFLAAREPIRTDDSCDDKELSNYFVMTANRSAPRCLFLSLSHLRKIAALSSVKCKSSGTRIASCLLRISPRKCIRRDIIGSSPSSIAMRSINRNIYVVIDSRVLSAA